MSNQLIKTTGQGKENVFPRTRIQDLFDDTSGQKLIDILKSFNMMFVPYLGNKSYTRNQISPELRRQGLWLTYVIDNTVYTEWYDEVAIDDTNWGSDSNWRQGSNALVGDLSVSPNGTWVINGEDSGITIKGDKGDSPVIRIYDNKIQVSYDKGVTYEDLNNTPVYTKFRFNSQTNTYQVSYDLGDTWQDISDEKVYHKFKYNQATNTYQESIDFGKTWSNVSAEKVYTKFRFNRSTNTYQVSTDLGQNWTDVSSDKVYYQFRYNRETNTHQVSTDFGTTWTNVSENKVFYQFRTNDNRLQVSTDLGATWENCSEPIAAWFRWADVSGTGNVGKVQISRDNKTWSDLSPTITNNLYIKGYVATVGNLPSDAAIGDIYMVGPTYDESDTTHDYPHYRMWVKQSSGWVDNGEYQSNVQISQNTGQETGITMSQKAITNEVEKQSSKLNELSNNTEFRDEEDNVIQTPFSYINSNKYLKVELDSSGKFLAGTLSDGSHYAHNMKSETIDELHEKKVDKEEGKSLIEDEVKECFNVIKDGIYPFCMIDNNRRVHLYVDKNGKTHLFGEIESPTIDAINKKISPVLYTTDLDGNVFFTVGDSLCTSGIWQLALCKYRNCSYDVSYGTEVSNMGGTITLDDNFRCGQSRLKRVIGDKNPMILIYENYNDISCLKNIGNKDDLPYFIGDNVIIGESFNSYEEASDYWTNNATELLASLEKKVGIVVKIPYNTRNQAGAVYVSGSAENDGFLSLRVNMKEVNITIKKGDNSTEILRKIEEVNYPNCRNERTENYVKFINNDGSQSWVEFTHTPQIDGVTFSIYYLDATTYLCKTFVSKDINKWNDITYWKSFGEISLWSAYKGLIEYFLKKCPTQRLIWFIPRVVFLERNSESSSYNPKLWYEDGTINIAEYKKNVGENDTLANLQKEVCQMYGIECIDLNDILGVNVVNESSWCNNHDVHPTEMLYNKWGWCISKLIK